MKLPVLYGTGGSPIGSWVQTIAVKAPNGASMSVSGGGETLTATADGDYYAFSVHNKSTQYTINVTMPASVGGASAPAQTVTTGTADGVITFKEFKFATITTSVTDAFEGVAVTCVSGGTTLTITPAVGTTSITFRVPSTGNWVISGVVSGDTYYASPNPVVISDLDDSTTATLLTRPDGKTVTPTDSIPLWLQCGGVNESYTTLDEVLADHDTLAILMTDHNAVDYMVRSKAWVKSTSIPNMTSNTQPSGMAFSYSAYESASEAYKAFDGSTSTYSAGQATNGYYIGYMFEKAVKITKFYLDWADLTSYKIQYSKDNITWKDATDTITTSSTSSGTYTGYIDENDVELAKYWRLLPVETYGNCHINELRFYSLEGITDNETAMRYIGKRNYAADTLLTDTNPTGLIPVMTDDTHPSGVASMSNTQVQEFAAYRAFDNTNIGWYVKSAAFVGNWLGYEFPQAKVVRSAELLVENQGTLTIELKATNDDTDWTNAATLATGVVVGTTKVELSFDNDTAYKYYRWYVTASTANTNSNGLEAQLYEKRLDEFRWCDAIAKSDYAKSVLNIYVPLMTDNTHPSGVASCSSYHSSSDLWNAYKAFNYDPLNDQVDTRGWLPTNGTVDSWVQYDFGNAVNICEWLLTSDNGASLGDSVLFELHGSNDDFASDDNFLGTIVAIRDEYKTIYSANVGDSTAYRYYRVILKGTNSTNGHGIRCQFYGRADVDETLIDIYSAAQDTVKDVTSGTAVTLCTTDNDGHYAISRTNMPNGEYTLESTVAYKPDGDLSTEMYSKQVKVDANTIEIFLMPDDTLYWYGYKPVHYDFVKDSGSNYYNDNTRNIVIHGYQASSTPNNYGTATVYFDGFTLPIGKTVKYVASIEKVESIASHPFIGTTTQRTINLNGDKIQQTPSGKDVYSFVSSVEGWVGAEAGGSHIEIDALWYE